MSALQLVVPLGVAAVLAAAAASIHRRIPPRRAALLLTATMIAVILAVLPALVIIAVGYVAHLLTFGGLVVWCEHALGVHGPVPAWLGVPSVGAVIVAVLRVVPVLGSWRSIRRTDVGGPEVVRSRAWFAYTLPGPGRRIVLSSALVDGLEPGEFAVVVAHERTHALHRHDRHVLVADVGYALLPFLRPLQHRLLFALERWADEAAVINAAGDRRIVARTIARVALADVQGAAPALGLAGLGVAARIDALTEPRSLRRPHVWTLGGGTGALTVLVAAMVQIHHLVPLIALCAG